MGTLGKVLIFFNILAAGAFIALATMSWGKRQPWTYAVLRYEVMIAGLPVEAPKNVEATDSDVVPFAFQYGDSPVVPTISTKALSDIFLGAQGGELLGGPPVPNQIAEVQRVRTAVDKAINEADGPEARRLLTRGFLINQARNGDERDRYAALTADAGKLEDARREIERLFTEALAPVAESRTDDKLNFPAKRRQIAHLLYHLSDKPEWHQRVYTVVGLEQYAQTVQAQAVELNAMVQRVLFAISDEQAKFEPKYQDIVQRCLFQQQELEKLQALLADQKSLIAGHEVIRNARANEVQLLETDLRDAAANAKKMLGDQAVAENTLFDIHVQLKLSLDTIVKLEETLRKVELLNTTTGR